MKHILWCLALILASSVHAQDKAEKGTVQEMLEYCQEIVDEEGAGKQTVDAFLLTCLNQELVAEGYQPIKQLPKS